MASDPLVITIDAVDYELVLPDDMRLGEQRAFEKIAGKGVDKLADMDGMDAGLVVAWMAVSIHRARPNTAIQNIVNRLDEMTPDDLAAAWANIQADQDGQSPPASSSENANTSATASVPSTAPTPGSMTPNGSGDPGTENGSASDQPTLVTSPPPN